MSNPRRKQGTQRCRLPRGRFRPPHCPNDQCPFFRKKAGWTYTLHGFDRPKDDPSRVQRYLCKHCHGTFSVKTFSPTYWLHRWDLFTRITDLSVAGAGLRQIGRVLGVSHTTVARHLTRAGRQCLLFHRELLEGRTLREPIAFDGFETFEYSQFFPFHLNLAAGQESWFLYHFTDSPLRRKGRMTEDQKRKRDELEERLGRPDPKAVELGTLELLQQVAALLPTDASGGCDAQSLPTFLLCSDEHPAYRRALKTLRAQLPSIRIRHQVTPSTDPRTRANALFPVNLADLLLRHCGANHRRETIAFSKRRQRALERAAVFVVWRNCIKRRREGKGEETAAMRAGILDRPIGWTRVFSRRRFPSRERLPGSWWSYYWGRVRTAVLGDRQSENRLRYAF